MTVASTSRKFSTIKPKNPDGPAIRNLVFDENVSHQPKLPKSFKAPNRGSTYSTTNHVPVVADHGHTDFVPMNASLTMGKQTSLTSQGQKRKRKADLPTPMQMIDNSLTVNIERDMFDRYGKEPPKQVNRIGSTAKLSLERVSRSSGSPLKQSKSVGKLPKTDTKKGQA